MIPEVRSALSHFLPEHKFPLTELLVCAGFFLVHLVDEIIVAFTSPAKTSTSNRVSPVKRPPPTSGECEPLPVEQTETEDRPVRSLLVVLALSFHSFIEGLAIGKYVFITISPLTNKNYQRINLMYSTVNSNCHCRNCTANSNYYLEIYLALNNLFRLIFTGKMHTLTS